MKSTVLILSAVFLLWVGFGVLPAQALDAPPSVATYSIVAADTVSGEWGVAVASKFLAVGAVVPWARAGVGAIATQAVANPEFGVHGLDLLKRGYAAGQVIETLGKSDSEFSTRQLGVVDSRGESATYTGERCQDVAGGLSGPGYAVQGNFLAHEDVLYVMARTFEESRGTLAERMLTALSAAEAAGGDQRGKQAAALLVVRDRGGYNGANDRYIDLRVDDHERPVQELQRLYGLQVRTLLTSVHMRLAAEAKGRKDDAAHEREASRVVYLYRQIIANSPDNADAKSGLAWFYARQRMNLDEALTLAQEAYSVEPESWEVLDTLAEIFFVRGQPDKAMEYSERALSRSPENPYLKHQANRFREAAAREDLR